MVSATRSKEAMGGYVGTGKMRARLKKLIADARKPWQRNFKGSKIAFDGPGGVVLAPMG